MPWSLNKQLTSHSSSDNQWRLPMEGLGERSPTVPESGGFNVSDAKLGGLLISYCITACNTKINIFVYHVCNRRHRQLCQLKDTSKMECTDPMLISYHFRSRLLRKPSRTKPMPWLMKAKSDNDGRRASI